MYSDDLYYKSKYLMEDRYELMKESIYFTLSERTCKLILKKRRTVTPSDEIDRIKDRVQECDPMTSFMHRESKGAESLEQENMTQVVFGNAVFNAIIFIKKRTSSSILKMDTVKVVGEKSGKHMRRKIGRANWRESGRGTRKGIGRESERVLRRD